MNSRLDQKFESEAISFAVAAASFDRNNSSVESLKNISGNLGTVFDFEKGCARMFGKSSDLIQAAPGQFVERDYGPVSFFVHKGALALEVIFNNKREEGRIQGINEQVREQKVEAKRRFGPFAGLVTRVLTHG